MGIQINGQTDTVTSTTAGGRVTVTPASFPSVNNINATGLSTFSGGLLVGTGASISSPATNVLTLGTNNVESVRIDSSGNTGIGTASPSYKLDVNGTLNQRGFIRLTDNINGGSPSDYWIGRGGAAGGSTAIYAPTSRAIELGVANNCYVTIEINALKLNNAATQILNNSGRPILNQSGSILQVAQTILNTNFSTTSQSYTNVTGLSVTITPSSTSSKILILAYLTATNTGQNGSYMIVTRNGSTMSGSLSSAGALNTTTGAVQSSFGFINQGGTTYTVVPMQLHYLDSPASTSAQTYQVQTRTGSANSVLVNHQGTNSNNNNNPDFGNYVSSITAIEVSA